MIGIIDFGAGNLKSAYHAFEANYPETTIIRSPKDIKDNLIGLVLPGDGCFPYAFNNLKTQGFVSLIRERSDIPLLGICVGFQLLFSESEEDGGSEGLNLIQGKVKRFKTDKEKIPHMGWNTATIKKESPLLAGIEDGAYFYFVHSYYAQAENDKDVLLETTYTHPFCAGVERDNVFGFQFHPEKSHEEGWKIVKNFVTYCKDKI